MPVLPVLQPTITRTASSSLFGACNTDVYCVVRYASGRDGHHAHVPGRSGHFEEPCGPNRSSPCYTYAWTLCWAHCSNRCVIAWA